MSKKKQVAALFSDLGLTGMLLRVRSNFNTHVRILGYHRVLDPKKAYDVANVSASPEQFELQLRYYKSNYDLIRFADLFEFVEGKTVLPKRPLLLTFDDGFADNYANAFPILKKHAVSATFFVSTSYIGTNQLFWFDRVGFLVKHTLRTQIVLSDGSSFEVPKGDRQKLIKELLTILKVLPDSKRILEIKHIESLCDLDPQHKIDPINLPMNWGQLKEMGQNGMEIMSHTHRHKILSKLDHFSEIVEEVRESKNLIEQNLGTDCAVLAYPVGKYNSYDQRSIEAVKQVGYKIACSYESGINVLPVKSWYELKRIHVNHDYDIKALASMIAMPEIFAF